MSSLNHETHVIQIKDAYDPDANNNLTLTMPKAISKQMKKVFEEFQNNTKALRFDDHK